MASATLLYSSMRTDKDGPVGLIWCNGIRVNILFQASAVAGPECEIYVYCQHRWYSSSGLPVNVSQLVVPPKIYFFSNGSIAAATHAASHQVANHHASRSDSALFPISLQHSRKFNNRFSLPNTNQLPHSTTVYSFLSKL